MSVLVVRRKTIYEYHRVNFKKEDIKNWTVIYLNALPTCMEKSDCSSCVTADIGFQVTKYISLLIYNILLNNKLKLLICCFVKCHVDVKFEYPLNKTNS